MTKEPIFESFCIHCRRTVYGKDILHCPACGSPLIPEAQ